MTDALPTPPSTVPFTRKPGRIVPAGAPRWDWHSRLYAVALAASLVAEFHAIFTNARQRGEVRAGLRSEMDYQHRTITECITALFAMHPDERHGRLGRTRRFALGVLLWWLPNHFSSNGEEM